MAYEVHIRRKDEANPLTMKDWLNYVEKDKELTYTNHVEITLPNGMTMGMSGEGMAVWKTEVEGEEYKITFTFRDEEISARYVDDFQIEKMKVIANKLNAVVVGDEDEEY
ncbi:hypothetical protein H1230_06730 [Paenibacillus sp. 19GGS1-52]|uniref:hypothetical protein n=1 Tax=Paenibacillus sp. 19GGS1-52 TaxID=2758563 RepID=UPI001EFA33D9|nr:hypothetical protein [Paenibacillus sp. 19GGS1-52]ULO08496.1 hypothetical protein H1230_06730 [Paenibacillus sp. 19GGS1-52]